MKNKDLKYGLPSLKKYPMPDAAHVRSAIRFFNYVDPSHEKELATSILKRMDEYNMSFEDFSVGEENRFKKYIPKSELKHHGITDMNWGVWNDVRLADMSNTIEAKQGEDLVRDILNRL